MSAIDCVRVFTESPIAGRRECPLAADEDIGGQLREAWETAARQSALDGLVRSVGVTLRGKSADLAELAQCLRDSAP